MEQGGEWAAPTAPQIFEVPPATAERLDKVLAEQMPEHSRARLQGWIEAGHVTVNGTVATKTRQRVFSGDRIEVEAQPAPEELAFTAEVMDLAVLDASPHWFVIDKPAGLVVHPAAGNWSGTLLNGLLHLDPTLAHLPRAGIVHRLDKDTSGVMVVARTDVAQTALVRQLQARTVGREYVALVQGRLTEARVIDRPVGRDAQVPVRMSVLRPVAPRPARTHVTPLASGVLAGRPVTWVRCRLETGRTHQIRVHLAAEGHPLVGDPLYGGACLAGATRQMLHARRLWFDDPGDGQPRHFQSAVADTIVQVLAAVTWDEPPGPQPDAD